jgi:hypothetical protein
MSSAWISSSIYDDVHSPFGGEQAPSPIAAKLLSPEIG